jgi:hypothetical protein
MSRLPIPGADNNTWGNVLNDYLNQSLDDGGILKASSVGNSQLQDGSISAAKITDGTISGAKLDSSTQASLSRADTALQTAPVTSVVGQTGAVTGTQIAADSGLATTYATLVEVVHTVAAAGAAQTLPDPSVQSISSLTLTAACTLTFPTATAGKSFMASRGYGSYTITWPATILWAGGVRPTLSTAVGAVDYITFICVNGSAWAGFAGGLDMKVAAV